MGTEGVEFAKALVQEAGEYIRRAVKDNYKTSWKGDNTPVTDIDITVNNMVVSAIGQKYPRDRVYGEEASSEHEPSGEHTCLAVLRLQKGRWTRL